MRVKRLFKISSTHYSQLTTRTSHSIRHSSPSPINKHIHLNLIIMQFTKTIAAIVALTAHVVTVSAYTCEGVWGGTVSGGRTIPR